MDVIIEELTNINLSNSILSDTERYKFENNITDELSELLILVKKIKNKMSEYHTTNEKINDIDLDRRRQKIIWKILFPQYWTISHTVNNATCDELIKIENDMKNTVSTMLDNVSHHK